MATFVSIYTRVAIAVSLSVVASMVSLLKTGKSFNIISHQAMWDDMMARSNGLLFGFMV